MHPAATIVERTLDAIKQPVIVASPTGTITAVNTAAVRLARRARHELVGTPVGGVLRLARHAHRTDVDLDAMFDELVRPARVGHGSADLDVIAIDAQIPEVTASIVELGPDDEQPGGWVITVGRRGEARSRAMAHRDRVWDVAIDLIGLVGRDGFFVDVNPAWSALGYDADELLAHDYLEVVHEDDRSRVADEVDALQRDKAFTVDFTCRMRERDGGTRWYQWSAIHDPYTDTICGIGHDVSHVLRRNQQLNQQVRSLRDRERQLLDGLRDAEADGAATAEAITRMSHEVRTPLSSVIGFAGLLAENPDGNLTAENLTQLERIRRNGLHVLGLIEDVLDLRRSQALDTGEIGPTDLVRTIDEAVTQTAGEAARKGIAVETDIPDGLAPIVASPRALVQVLINLLGNAIKYSDVGPVVVGVHRNPAGTPDRLDVVDHGPGIPPAVRGEIFTPFWRGDDDDDDDDTPHGSGLGLAIAQALCRDMGFDLAVESAEGRGSTFSVLLLEDAELPTHPGDCPHA